MKEIIVLFFFFGPKLEWSLYQFVHSDSEILRRTFYWLSRDTKFKYNKLNLKGNLTCQIVRRTEILIPIFYAVGISVWPFGTIVSEKLELFTFESGVFPNPFINWRSKA